MKLRIILIAGCTIISGAASAETTSLVCLGAGSGNRASSAYAFGGDSNGNTGWGQVVSQRAVPYDDQVNIELSEAGAKIRMPRALLPALRGGKDGWFVVKDLRRSEGEITGTIKVSIVNSPKLRLDRMTGHISISGKTGDYTGRCEPYDPKAAKPKF